MRGRLFRPLLSRPSHPVLAVLVLAAGLAATISTFTYIRAFSRPFPGVESDGLLRLFDEREGQAFGDVSWLDFLDYRDAAAESVELGAVQRFYAASVRHEARAEVAFIEAISGEYFPVVRARAHIGRLLGPEDDLEGSEPATVISYAWWQTSFGGREDILGQTIQLNFRPFTIVGVTAPEFLGSNGDSRPQLWMPIAHFRTRYTNWDAAAQDRDVPLVMVLGRVRESVSPARARQELERLATNLDREFARPESPRRLALRPATWLDPSSRIAESDTIRIMTLAALGFLLLVCANVANILLSIASTEDRSNAIRAAVGASPRRLALEGLVRNLSLAIAAGGIGLLLAVPLSKRLGDYFARPSVWGEYVPRAFSVDGSVVAFGLTLALLTGLVATLPALRATLSHAPKRPLHPEADLAPRAIGRRLLPFSLRDVMVSVQSGLAILLLILSGLVLRTFSTTNAVSPGFESSDLVGGLVSVSSLGIPREESRAFFDGLLEALRREPWVAAASVGGALPLSGHPTAQVRSATMVEGVPMLMARHSHDFLDVLGAGVIEGRGFEPLDDPAEPSVLLNRSAAEVLSPEGAAVGMSLTVPGPSGGPIQVEVAGVVEDVKLRSLLAEPEPAFFVRYDDATWPTTNAILVRTAGPATPATIGEFRRWMNAYEPHMTVINSVSYRDVVAGSLYTQRMNAELFTGVAGLGLALACAGIFSVVSLAVTRRRREIGIRKAMGATPLRIQARMVGRALLPVAVGGATGFGLALIGAGLVESLLFGISPLDPTALLAGVVTLLLASALAAFLPAWKASRIPARVSLTA